MAKRRRTNKKKKQNNGTNENAPVVPETIVEPMDDYDLYDKGSLDPEDHVLKTDEATQEVRKKLIRTGRYSNVASSLSNALVECGWKTDVENYCKWELRKNPDLTHHELVELVRIRARNLVPSSIKQNLAEHIQTCYMEPELPKHVSPLPETSFSGESSSTIISSKAKKKRSKSSQGVEPSSAQKTYSHSDKLDELKKSSKAEETPSAHVTSFFEKLDELKISSKPEESSSAQKTSSHSEKFNAPKKSSKAEESLRALETSSHSEKLNTPNKSSHFDET